MIVNEFIDTDGVAAEVVVLMSMEDGISQNDAMIRFMGSETFRRLIGDPKVCVLRPSEILQMYHRECGETDRIPRISDSDRIEMKIGITREFSERYGMSIPETVDLFGSNGIYDYLDKGADMFIHRMYPFMANDIARKLGIPVVR